MTAIVFVACSAAVADDLKISQLEQAVRELKQQLLQYSRRIERLEAESTRSNANRRPIEAPPSRAPEEAPSESRVWLDIRKWDRVRVGMGESDVLSLLGPPTTMRKSNGTREMLFYALELGASSFLSGSVTLDNKQVVEFAKPVLK
jgi:hypothetical protein